MLYCRVAAILAGMMLVAPPAAADVRSDFSNIAAQILMRQTRGPLAEMSEAKRLRMVDCINAVLDGLPKGKKRYILEGGTIGEQERRFGKVLFENRAEWIQKIAGGCARIAMGADA
jgi:hypothetical protein